MGSAITHVVQLGYPNREVREFVPAVCKVTEIRTNRRIVRNILIEEPGIQSIKDYDYKTLRMFIEQEKMPNCYRKI